ncbi:MAG TPA: Rieske 2Fe-2S domain-containing protein [Candidatus Binatia bacterium]
MTNGRAINRRCRTCLWFIAAKGREAKWRLAVWRQIKRDGEANFKGRDVGRRELLNWFLGTGVGALLISILYPVTRYIIPPRVEESTTRTVNLSVKPGDVKANSGQIFKFGSQPGILIRSPGGDLRAFTAICTHLACIVQYRADLGHVWCACHNGHFDLNGKNIAGPPPRPLEPYAVNVRGEQIVVSKAA